MNALLNLIYHQQKDDDGIIDKNVLYANNPYEPKYCGQSIIMILQLLMSTQMIWMILMRKY